MKIKTALISTLFFVGCLELPTVPPAPVDIAIAINLGDALPTENPTSGQVGSVTLSPPSITLAVGQIVNVTVTARSSGQEIPSSDITVAVLPDSNGLTIARFAGRTDRTIQIEGLIVGTTEAIVSASGFQASLPISVE